MSYYENLVTYMTSHSSTKLIISAIIQRPCDLEHDPSETPVKKLNRELKSMGLRRDLQFLHTFRPFLHFNNSIRSLYAVKDGGLHLNTKSSRKLRVFFILTQLHIYGNGCFPCLRFLSVSDGFRLLFAQTPSLCGFRRSTPAALVMLDRFEMTEILLKGRKTLTHPSI